MVKKIVRYNGDSMSFYPCSKPDKLVVGQEYEVVLTRDKGYHTNYTLKGVDGEYNSVWFDDVFNDEKKIYLGFSEALPQIGERYKCTRLEFVVGSLHLVDCSTSKVQEIEYLGNNVYQVTTLNNIYIVIVK